MARAAVFQVRGNLILGSKNPNSVKFVLAKIRRALSKQLNKLNGVSG